MSTAHLLARAVEGVQERTVCGAIVTFGALLSIVSLLFFEVSAFFAPVTIHHLGVDDGDSAWGSRSFKVPDRLPIMVHMTFAHVECDDLEIGVESARGLREAINHVEFRRPTPSELAAWAPAADAEKACTLDGRLTVGKVSANFHVGLSAEAGGPPGARGPVGIPAPLAMLVGQITMMEKHRHVNITHKVHSLSFGKKTRDTVAPLDGVVNSPTESGQMHYILKVIPTVIHGTFGHTMTNQYSLAESFIPERRLLADPTATPGVYFYYDFYPVTIEVAKERKSLPEFAVSICAIVGGCFSLAAMVDGVFFKSAKVLSGKKD